MHDKDFDQLFRNKLADLEIEPSKDVWAGITAGLDADKKRKVVMLPWISAAASVTVLLTAGLLFIKKYPSGVKHPKANPVSTQLVSYQPKKSDPAVQEQVEDQPETATKDAEPAKSTKPTSRIAAELASVRHPDRHKSVDQQIKQEPDNTENQTIGEPKQIALAAIDKQVNIQDNAQMVPDGPIRIETANKTTETPVLASAAPKSTDKVQPKKHRIHNMGDLLNVVIAKVDKRQDKVVEFTETDDESNITSINLGFLSIKKDK